MLEASLELNRALKGFLKVSKSLGQLKEPKACDLKPDARLKACSKFMKVYELCVRVDEALRDLMRHQDTKQAKESLHRAGELIDNLSEVVASLSPEEKRMLLAYMRGEFSKYRRHLEDLLKRRPARRIWGGDELTHITEDFSTAVEALRKTAAYVMLMLAAPDESEKAVGRLVC